MLILSGKNALEKRIKDVRPIEKAVDEYIESQESYQIHFCYHDVSNKYRLKPVKKDAGAIRNYVQRIEKKLGTIDILLLLGGDEVIPFFRLNNPCDDSDEYVLSDNPYASRDDNYTIPERVCARIPDNKSADFMKRQFKKSRALTGKSFGLSAKIWYSAAQEVYLAIGDPKELKASPPVTADTLKRVWLQDKDFLYFNLHGSKASENWYGQAAGEYPVALQPTNIENAAGVVASEACYGAYIINKNEDEAISLKFLERDGVLCFCGSTTIAYGPVQPPSSEADLLVRYFFEFVKRGMTTGESLKNAKLDFARKAVRRHGFLDDDDQKTLLQFVLYGDPILRVQDKLRRS
jgi:hypothetical protein